MVEFEEAIDASKKVKAPILFIELVDQANSGFVLDGTRGTPNETQLRAPGIRFIPNEGYRRGHRIDIVNGKEKEVFFNEKIRYIKNEEIIVVSEQKRLGIEPSPLAREDKIPIEKGFATIVREGSSIGLYDFIFDSYYNDSNPHRSEKATALYRIVELDKQNERINEDELVAADAVKVVGSLYQKTGKNAYVYHEEKIDAICEMLAIVAETYASKIRALMSLAKQQPDWFLDKVTKLEQTTITLITHALELNVLRFNNNTAEYVTKDKVVKSLGAGKLSHDQKIMRLGDFLRTAEGHEAHMELQAEVEVAMNNSLKH